MQPTLAIVAPAPNPFPKPRHLAEEIGRMTGCTVIAADIHSTSEVLEYALVCAEDEWHCGNFLRMLPTAAMRHGFRAGATQFCKNLAEEGRGQWRLALAGAERAFYDSTNVAFAKGSIFGRGGGGTPVQTAADRMDVRAGGLEGRAEGVARRRGPEPAGL